MARPAKSPAPFSLSVVPKTTNTNILLSAKPFYDLADSNNYKILDYVPRILVFSLFENYSALSSAVNALDFSRIGFIISSASLNKDL